MTDNVSPERAQRAISVSEQIAVDLRERIARGDYQPGELIPSEREIIADWSVAKMTASRAVQRLKSEGLVETIPGRGLVVLGRKAGVGPAAQLSRMHTTGRIRLPNERTEVVDTGTMSTVTMPREIVAAVGHTVQSGSTLYRRRIIYRDDQVMCLATSWIPATALSTQPGWPDVERRLLNPTTIPEGTPRLLADLVGEDPCREDYTASAEAATATEAHDLGVTAGAPVLRVVTSMYGETWPLECGVYTYPAGTPCVFPSAEHRS